jgi:large subunit ribosomal protein L6
MSRIGKEPITLPSGVEVRIEGRNVQVKGPKGQLSWTVPEGIGVTLDGGVVKVEDQLGNNRGKALHGVSRTIIANMVTGVSQGFKKTLEIVGTGYRAQVEGKNLVLNLQYNHPVVFPIPEGIEIKVEDRPLRVIVSGIDKQLVGQTAANIRAIQPPEPYKGKGIRYEGEQIRRKVGKAAG